jgi:hypothetical protein
MQLWTEWELEEAVVVLVVVVVVLTVLLVMVDGYQSLLLFLFQ